MSVIRLRTVLQGNLRLLQVSSLAFVLVAALVMTQTGLSLLGALMSGFFFGGFAWIPCAILFIGFQLMTDDSAANATPTESPRPEPDPFSEARDRYIRGEIDEDEFEARLDRLLDDDTSESSRVGRETELATERR